MQGQRNIAARAGRWSARHRKTAILGWITFVVLAFMIGGKVGTESRSSRTGGRRRLGQGLEDRRRGVPRQARGVGAGPEQGAQGGFARVPRGRGRRGEAARGDQGRQGVHGPYDQKEASAISGDGHSALVTFEIPGDPTDEAVTATVDETWPRRRRPEVARRLHRRAVRRRQLRGGVQEDLRQGPGQGDLRVAADHADPAGHRVRHAGRRGHPAAAGDHRRRWPRWASSARSARSLPVEDSITHVVLLIGLAVGVDYSLFYLRRVREERAAGRDKEAAIEAAAATSGRAVLVSGFTVMIAMAGMYLAGAPDVHLVRHRHDRRRRRGDDRLAHRAAGDAVGARRPGRQGPRPRPRTSPRPCRPDRHLVAHRGPGAPPPAAVGRAGHGGAGGAGDPGAAAGHGHAQHLGLAAAGRAGRADVQPRAEGVPGRDAGAETWSSRPRTSRRPRSPTGVAELEKAAAEHKSLFPGTDPEISISPDKTVATVAMEIAGDGTDDEVGPGPGRAPGRGRAGHASVRSKAWRPTSTARPRRTATSTTR